MARTLSREIRLAANAVVFEKENGPKDGILKALVVSQHGREKATWLAGPVLSKNTNELKTGAPGRFDRHRPMASPRSGACRRRCRRFGFPVRAGKNTVQQRDATLPGGDLDPGPGSTWTRTC